MPLSSCLRGQIVLFLLILAVSVSICMSICRLIVTGSGEHNIDVSALTFFFTVMDLYLKHTYVEFRVTLRYFYHRFLNMLLDMYTGLNWLQWRTQKISALLFTTCASLVPSAILHRQVANVRDTYFFAVMMQNSTRCLGRWFT